MFNDYLMRLFGLFLKALEWNDLLRDLGTH